MTTESADKEPIPETPKAPEIVLKEGEVIVDLNSLQLAIEEIDSLRTITRAQAKEIEIFQGMMELGLRHPRNSGSRGMAEDPVYKLRRSMRKK